MVTRLFLLTLTLAHLLLAGCGTPMRFSTYTGSDASSVFGPWRIGGGTMAETSFRIPVYQGWPERNYKVLGSIRHENPSEDWNEGTIAQAAREGKIRGGDAVILRRGAEAGVGKIADGKGGPLVYSSSQTTALVIRWLTEEEIEDQQRLLDEFLKAFEANVPNVSANRTAGQLVMTHLVQSGLRMDSAEMRSRFVQEMTKLASGAPDSLSGSWVYKATINSGTALESGDERNGVGLASVSAEADSIAIVSSSGNIELSFAGTSSKGKLTGQIGVGTFSTKGEGASTRDKISLSFQSLTRDGVVRGNVVLERLVPKP